MSFLSRLYNPTQGKLRRHDSEVDEINALEEEMMALSDAELETKTTEFRGRLTEGDELDDLLVEAFAVAREAAHRNLGMRPFDMQCLGGAGVKDNLVSRLVSLDSDADLQSLVLGWAEHKIPASQMLT